MAGNEAHIQTDDQTDDQTNAQSNNIFSEALIMSQLNNTLVDIINNDNPSSSFYDLEADISEFVEKSKTFENQINELKEDNKYYKSEINKLRDELNESWYIVEALEKDFLQLAQYNRREC